ncbi:MAG: FadR/GntR family transcriptional regulator [Eubacteriaceae bacterium]
MNYLKTNLLNGEITLGDKLPPERELAEQLGISRNSLREAIRTLEMMGFLSSEQGAGNFVSCNISRNLADSLNLLFLLGQIDYRQVSETRKALEMQAAILASDRITPVQIAQIERVVKSMRSDDERLNIEADRMLHDLIAQASQNQLIIQLLTALSDAISSFIADMRREIALNPEGREELQRSHEQLVEGLRRSDKKEISDALNEHFHLVDTNIKAI